MDEDEIQECVEDKDYDRLMELVFQEYGGQMKGYVRKSVEEGADWENVYSEVLVKLFNALESYDPQRATSFEGWMWTVVRNRVIDCYRTSRRSIGKTVSLEQIEEALDVPLSQTELMREEKTKKYGGFSSLLAEKASRDQLDKVLEEPLNCIADKLERSADSVLCWYIRQELGWKYKHIRSFVFVGEDTEERPSTATIRARYSDIKSDVEQYLTENPHDREFREALSQLDRY